MRERPRPWRGLPGLFAHLTAALVLTPRWMRAPSAARGQLERRFFARVLRALGVEVSVVGVPLPTGGTLFLANHISFTDVLALGTQIDAVFVTKSDVRGWPAIGALAERHGAVFVDRGRTTDAPGQAERVAAQLKRGRNVVLFPEGTTSDGAVVLPFYSALLRAAAAARTIQPVAIRYSDNRRRAYIGTESFVANLIRLAPHRAVVELIFLPAFSAETPLDRKALARNVRAMIVATLATSAPVPSSA